MAGFGPNPELLDASVQTLEVAVLAMLIGILLGLMLALIKTSGNRSIRWLAIFFD